MGNRVKYLLLAVMFILIEGPDTALAKGTAVPTLTAWTSRAMLPALQALAPGFEQAHGLKLQLEVASASDKNADSVGRRLARKESADVVVMNDFEVAKLRARGHIVLDSRVEVGKSFIAMAVREGVRKPDIHSAQAFKQALLAADSIGYTGSASGLYLSRVLFMRMGLTAAFQRKTHLLAAGALAQALADGQVDLGFQEFSELKPLPGVDIVGLIPDSLQQMTLYSAAVFKASAHREAAQALVDYLASPPGREAIVASGLQRVR